jgi:hypothetical protein
MLVINAKEIKDNQKTYFDKVDEDDTRMSKEELFEKIDRALLQYKEGKYKVLTPELKEELFGDI